VADLGFFNGEQTDCRRYEDRGTVGGEERPPFPFRIREGVWLGGCCVPAPENFFLNLMPWHIVARNYYNVKRRAVARYKTRFAGVYITFTRNRPYTSSKTSITGESVHV